jgi:hypothetical protein
VEETKLQDHIRKVHADEGSPAVVPETPDASLQGGDGLFSSAAAVQEGHAPHDYPHATHARNDKGGTVAVVLETRSPRVLGQVSQLLKNNHELVVHLVLCAVEHELSALRRVDVVRLAADHDDAASALRVVLRTLDAEYNVETKPEHGHHFLREYTILYDDTDDDSD